MEKLKKKLKTLLSSRQHTRTFSLIGLVCIVTAIPMTVYIAQQSSDNRQYAADPTGFKSIRAFGCGEIIATPAEGALEGSVTYRAPIKTALGWQTHTRDGGILTTDYIFRRLQEGWPETERNISRVIEEYTLSCNLKIVYGGDCSAEVIGPGTSKENMLAQGETTTIQIKPGTDASSGCDETVLMRARHGSKPPADYPNVTPWPTGWLEVTAAPSAPKDDGSCTDSDGGLVYDQLGVVTNNTDPALASCDNNGNCTVLDSCVDGKLTEYYCKAGMPKSEQYTCALGCGDKWTCKNAGTPLPTGVLPTSVVPSVTVTPTVSVTRTPTPTQTPTVTTPTPSPTVSLTPTIPKTPTIFSLTFTLPGIGANGNGKPNNEARQFTFQLFDKSNKQVGSDVVGTASFSGGNYTATVNMGTIVASDTYSIKVKLHQFLLKTIPSVVVTAGGSTTVPAVILAGGDINNDNKLDVLDYNILVSCYGKKAFTDTCSGKMVDSDVNDDGNVDGVDYNLFLAGFKAAKNEK